MQTYSLDQKIAQLFVVSFAHSHLTQEDIDEFTKHKFSNFIYFARNLENYKAVAELSRSLQEIAKQNCNIPAFIAIDQEGGMVTRVYSGATHFPTNMAITASNNADSVYEMGKMVGTELLRMGINLNLAPVLDVNNNPYNPVIGIRSYSDNPEIVSQMGVDYLKGLQSAGVLASAKHFPGHGDVTVDSHLSLPVVDYPMERLEKVELLPFKAAIKAGVSSIMSAHVVFPSVDKTRLPATLSSEILTKFLRETLNFQGIVMTDGMQMEAIRSNYGIERGAVLAIQAGVDLLCMTGSHTDNHLAFEAIKKAVADGTIPISRIDDAFERILSYKKQFHLNFDFIPFEQLVEIYPKHEQLAEKMSRESITLVRDPQKLLPLGNCKLLAISTLPIRANLAENSTVVLESFAEVLAKTQGANYREIELDVPDIVIQEIVEASINYDKIVVATYNAILNRQQALLVKRLTDIGANVIVVALRLPYDCKVMPESVSFVAAYEYTKRSIYNVCKCLAGDIPFMGVMPVADYE
ncbi:beta-N-acetylhexosaminidase [Paludicola sp. MB14-C6]|uniref:beta-N-acetylhexosaminidase n=1 Tax=Paludihabitans sp. MB14-C6 TaxID=3070656 RepID=UPI0027DCCEF0|nr:beta-N-acetylhexosaminidase [Paludicola sp. MB14-C6]WMJ22117.1 beta-N-acetylhexosaminidase [Paludicola sp. MB14-C6]